MKQQHQISATWVKEHISIVDLLANLGHPPPKPTGKERYYNSPLREDPAPSFCVDERKGTWYDHGDDIGGNIIDLGKRLWKELSFPEVLEKIVSLTNSGYLINHPASPIRQKQDTVKEPHYHILNVQDIGLNNVITEYLQSRGIWQTAKGGSKKSITTLRMSRKNAATFSQRAGKMQTGPGKSAARLILKPAWVIRLSALYPATRTRWPYLKALWTTSAGSQRTRSLTRACSY